MLTASVKIEGKVATHRVEAEVGDVRYACWRKTSAREGSSAVLADFARLVSEAAT